MAAALLAPRRRVFQALRVQERRSTRRKHVFKAVRRSVTGFRGCCWCHSIQRTSPHADKQAMGRKWVDADTDVQTEADT